MVTNYNMIHETVLRDLISTVILYAPKIFGSARAHEEIRTQNANNLSSDSA